MNYCVKESVTPGLFNAPLRQKLLSNVTRILHHNAKVTFETGEPYSSHSSHSLDRALHIIRVTYSCKVKLIALSCSRIHVFFDKKTIDLPEPQFS